MNYHVRAMGSYSHNLFSSNPPSDANEKYHGDISHQYTWAGINHGLWIIEHLCCKTNGLWSVNHTKKHLQGLLALFITPKSGCSFINRTSVKICRNYSHSHQQEAIQLWQIFFKLLMVISSVCDSCFIPILAESLLFPSVLLGYSTFHPRLKSGHVLSQAWLALCHSAAWESNCSPALQNLVFRGCSMHCLEQPEG